MNLSVSVLLQKGRNGLIRAAARTMMVLKGKFKAYAQNTQANWKCCLTRSFNWLVQMVLQLNWHLIYEGALILVSTSFYLSRKPEQFCAHNFSDKKKTADFWCIYFGVVFFSLWRLICGCLICQSWEGKEERKWSLPLICSFLSFCCLACRSNPLRLEKNTVTYTGRKSTNCRCTVAFVSSK